MKYPIAVVLLVASGVWCLGSAGPLESEFQQTYPGAQIYRTPDGRITCVGGAQFTHGTSPEESAAEFIHLYAGLFGVAPDELRAGIDVDALHAEGPVRLAQPVMYDRALGGYDATLLYFSQHRDGIPVFRADLRLLVSNHPGHATLLANSTLRDLAGFALDLNDRRPSIDLAQQSAKAFEPELVNFSDPRDVIWAGVDEMVVSPRPAVEFTADNGDPLRPKAYLFVADADTGEIVFRESLIHHADVSGTVSAVATVTREPDPDNPGQMRSGGSADCSEEQVTVMPYARVAITGGNSAFADANGSFVIPHGGTDAVTVTSRLEGRWFEVTNTAGGNSVLSQQVTPPGPAQLTHDAAGAQLYLGEINAYVQSNIVRDYTLHYHPAFPVIAGETAFDVNVNIDSTCNAFYNSQNQSINFYRANGGCPNTAFSTVVHHEYGHRIVNAANSGQGAYGEGFSDVMGVLVTDDHVLARGWTNGNCTGGLRDADNSCQYRAVGCSSCGSESHACGRLLAGCVWDLRETLKQTHPATYRDVLSDLAINSVLLHGSTSGITPAIYTHFLTLDDMPSRGGNNDLTDGSPHFAEITAAFEAHGMAGPPRIRLRFEYPNGRPLRISPRGGTVVRVRVIGDADQPQPGTGKLHYRVFVRGTQPGPFAEVNMTEVSPNIYDAAFPAFDCGMSVQYYVSAQNTIGLVIKDPDSQYITHYSTVAAYTLAPLRSETFEIDTGWTVSNSGGLTSGAWMRAAPADGGGDGDPAGDFDGSDRCFFTGAGGDVDGGFTYLKSPVLPLANRDPVISYARWYWNHTGPNPGQETFSVQLTATNPEFWQPVETVGPDGAQARGGWHEQSFRVRDILTPSNQLRLQFIAADRADATIEAALDYFRVFDVGCVEPPCDGCDLNCDGSVNQHDIEPFVQALSPSPPAACSPCAGDANDDGSVNQQDVQAFVDCLTG